MSEAAKEKTYSEAEIKARLQQELPRWIYEGGWIRRTYKTASWKGTLMVINTIGHLAEGLGIIPILPPLMLGSKSGSRIMPPRESPTRISIWRKKSTLAARKGRRPSGRHAHGSAFCVHRL